MYRGKETAAKEGVPQMKRISRITGLAAVADGTGRRAGRVLRVCVSADGQWVTGLILLAGSLLRRKGYVPFEHITLWGEVTVTVSAVQPVPKALRGAHGIVGLTVTDTCGERVGRVTDAFVEVNTGSVTALEVSQGFVDDFLTGRVRVTDFTLRHGGVVAAMEAGGQEDVSSDRQAPDEDA